MEEVTASPIYRQYYSIEVYTGDAPTATTHANVNIELFDEHGNSSGIIPITSVKLNKDIFFRNKASEVRMLANPTGKLQRIRITCTGKFHTWFLKDMVIRTMGNNYRVSYNNWVKNEINANLEFLDCSWTALSKGSLVLGPILQYRGMDTSTAQKMWKLSAMIATHNVNDIAEVSQLQYHTNQKPEIRSVSPLMYQEWQGYKLWRFDFDVELFDYPQICTYSILDGSMTYDLEIPSLNEKPRMFFGSCLDRANPLKMDHMSDRSATWLYADQEHTSGKYHLFILGGDQVYSDQLERSSDDWRKWAKLNDKGRAAAPLTPQMAGA
eukprot:TRINITY_DN8956_c0_g1_i2.p1 TRINITY_DN8956_c0_g1~~TRINITY_DN8956_c0_g1_i2.p1  ORF type:complete len:324 (-),score=48.44 TRINITY_DN8956_c0_g1_i2:117-1088(-)